MPRGLTASPAATTRTLTLPEDVASQILGPADAHLRELDRLLAADVHVRGDVVTLNGHATDTARAEAAIRQLIDVARTGTDLDIDAVGRIVDIALQKHNLVGRSAADLLGMTILSRRGKDIRPKTEGQSAYVDAVDHHDIVLGLGPAGTGKTYLAVAKAVAALHNKEVTRIILTRPAVEAGERLGYLPGGMHEKIDPYLRPLYDALRDMMDPEALPRLLDTGVLEVAPLAYMRGRTLNNAFVILDEAQNTTSEQMKMFLTRLGFGSTMVVTGDSTQVDLPQGTRSGLDVAREVLADVEGVAVVELTSSDVVRHSLVSRIVDAYESYETAQAKDASGRRPRERQRTRHNGATGSASARAGASGSSRPASGTGRGGGPTTNHTKGRP